MFFISSSKAQRKIAENTSRQRLGMNLTQEGLSERSGVPLSTLRKFEQKGVISLDGFLKLQMALGRLEGVLKATEPLPEIYSSIDEVLNADNNERVRKRGRCK